METLEQIKNRAELAVRGAKIDIVPNPGPSQQASLLIDNDHAAEVAKFLRDHPALGFDFCSNVTGVDWLDRVVKKTTKVKQIVAGGAERSDSVRAGLDHLSSKSDFVAVHDAARPLVTPEKITRVFEVCRTSGGAATLAEPINDTLKRADVDLAVKESVDRNGIYGMQTPQVFSRKMLEEAYQVVAKKKVSVTDEVSAVELLGRKVMLVANHDFNFKITYPRDLPMAEFVLKQRAANK